MCGRVSAVSKRPVFDLVRERAGFGAGLATLIASQIVNLMTCAAEVGGVAICFQLLSGLPYRLLIPLAVLVLVAAAWVLPFAWLERVFGYLGLGLLVFAVAAIKLHPDWGGVAHGFVPGPTRRRQPLGLPLLRRRPARRRDDAVRGLLLLLGRGRGSLGHQGSEAQQRDRDHRLRARRLPLVRAHDRRRGALPAERASRPSSWARRRSPPQHELGQVGLLLALVGILFAVGGAAVETSFAGAYNIAQFFGWRWGKKERPAARLALHALVADHLRRSPCSSS